MAVLNDYTHISLCPIFYFFFCNSNGELIIIQILMEKKHKSSMYIMLLATRGSIKFKYSSSIFCTMYMVNFCCALNERRYVKNKLFFRYIRCAQYANAKMPGGGNHILFRCVADKMLMKSYTHSIIKFINYSVCRSISPYCAASACGGRSCVCSKNAMQIFY